MHLVFCSFNYIRLNNEHVQYQAITTCYDELIDTNTLKKCTPDWKEAMFLFENN